MKHSQERTKFQETGQTRIHQAEELNSSTARDWVKVRKLKTLSKTGLNDVGVNGGRRGALTPNQDSGGGNANRNADERFRDERNKSLMHSSNQKEQPGALYRIVSHLQ